MKTNLLLRYSALCVALLLASGLVSRGQAQTNNSTAPPAPSAPVSTLDTLDEAYNTLVHANHNYNGHRAEAMNQVQLAVKELGGKIGGHGKKHESKTAADADMRAAQSLLEKTAGSLTGKPLKHVNNAIDEIKKALAGK